MNFPSITRGLEKIDFKKLKSITGSGFKKNNKEFKNAERIKRLFDTNQQAIDYQLSVVTQMQQLLIAEERKLHELYRQEKELLAEFGEKQK